MAPLYGGGMEVKMKMSISANGRTLNVHIAGELDHHASKELRESIDRALENSGAVNVAFDMSRTSFMDSSGIGVIMGRFKKVRALGGQIVIAGASQEILKIIEMSGIEKHLIIADSGTGVKRVG